MYALNLNTDNHILSACIVLPSTPASMPRVDTLPDGDIINYRYEGGEYIYDPLPESEPPVPQPSDIDILKEQVTMIEDALCEMDEANEERIAAIEDALCELDKEEE